MLGHFKTIKPIFVTSTAPEQQEFAFVTVNNPKQLKQKTKQSLIRQHAKRNVDRAKAREFRRNVMPLTSPVVESVAQEITRPNEVEAMNNDNLARQDCVRSTDTTDQKDSSFEMPSSLSFLRPLGAGRGVVPFAVYPIQTTPRMIKLLDHMLDLELPRKQPMRILWINIAMDDEGSFNIMLAQASNMLVQQQLDRTQESVEAVKYYTQAVRTVSQRLQNPVQSGSNELIGVILGLACLDVTYHNWRRWDAHMAGVQRILQLRGGEDTIHQSREMSIMGFWNDVQGSLVLDQHPRMPVTVYLSPTVEALDETGISNYKRQRKLDEPCLQAIGDCLAKLANIAAHIDLADPKDDAAEQQAFIANDVNPITHMLLSETRPPSGVALPALSAEDKIHEILRLAALLFVGHVRNYCRVSPTGLEENSERLSALLLGSSFDWTIHHDLLVWATVIGAISSKRHRVAYAVKVTEIARQFSMSGWRDVLSIATHIVWSSRVCAECVLAGLNL